MQRRLVLIGLLTASLAAQAALPQRNLLVQWRVVSSQSGQQGSGGLRQGSVVVDSRRGVSGSASVGWSTLRSQGTQDADGHLLVLNGARASLNLSQAQPLTVWQWAVHVEPSPQGSGASRPTSRPHHPSYRHDTGTGPAPAMSLWSDTVWVERGQGVRVRPRWSGGRALVELELEADMASSPADASERTAVSTTLGLPLGEWATVARTGAQQQGQRAGAWSSSTEHSEAQSELQIRISLP
jgi:hypothetical protein